MGLAHTPPNYDNTQSVDVLEVDVDEVCNSLRPLFPVDSHFSAAGNGSHNGVLGPSIVTLTTESRILVHSQLLIGVNLMCFTAEKTCLYSVALLVLCKKLDGR